MSGRLSMVNARELRLFLGVLSALAVAFGASAALAQLVTNHGAVKITRMASDLDEPWAIGFLPGRAVVITERGGALHYFDGQGRRHQVAGVPPVFAEGQGGLLDVVPARDFSLSRRLFFTYAMPDGRGGKTALAHARLSEDTKRLVDWTVIYALKRADRGGRHFGSRVVEARDGTLYLTIGDRGDRDQAQNPATALGAVVRVNPDGSLPRDMPDFGASAAPGLWSIGHRNPQGAAMDAKGRIWVVEHGPRGGDEVNRLRRGANFGWPLIGYGTHYSGAKVGVGTHKLGLEQPEYYWDPSIAPSGMMIYQGKMFPDWRGDMFVGSLKFDYIARLRPEDGKLAEVEQITAPETGRVRDLREAPDGSIWFLSVADGAAYRMSR